MKIQSQLISFVCIIITLSGLASVYFADTLLQNINSSENIRKVAVIIDTNSKSVIENLINNHAILIQKDFFEPILQLKEIEFIYLTDFDGKVFTHSFGHGFPTDLYARLAEINEDEGLQAHTFLNKKTKIFEVSKPLIDGMRARIFIGINNDQISFYYRNMQRQIVTFLLILAFISLCAAVVLARVTTSPLRNLIISIRNFGADTKIEQLATNSSCTEINDLAGAFNDMVSLRNTAKKDLERHQEKLEETVQKRTKDLNKALSEVKTLSSFLPICASCKKIRDDQGAWNQIESYISAHTDTEFSHCICPGCAVKLYPPEITKHIDFT